jgi:alkanesulfonate monooxygenase SsuD/methylene tetrahydromethanopterin reductase-like flavin-dependent oxidoreductase (luciferase family)
MKKPVEVKVVLTPNQDVLRQIDGRINSLRISHPESGEIARMEAARADVVSRMDEAEIQGYIDRNNVVKTPQQLAKEAQDLERAMAENRDRPSI